MFRTIVTLSALASAAAFSPMPLKSGLKSKSIKMAAEDMVGSLAPVGFFDPLQLSAGKSDGELKKIREAELKHGRVAMVAALGILIGENPMGILNNNPLFDGKITGPAIFQFQQADDINSFFWVGVLFSIALVEVQNILTGWDSPAETQAKPNSWSKGVAELKDDYINGDLGFDPLGLMPTDSAAFDEMRTKELQNGRLAMLGVAGIVAQELVNGKGVIENLMG
jgi:hypothetical protein